MFIVRRIYVQDYQPVGSETRSFAALFENKPAVKSKAPGVSHIPVPFDMMFLAKCPRKHHDNTFRALVFNFMAINDRCQWAYSSGKCFKRGKLYFNLSSRTRSFEHLISFFFLAVCSSSSSSFSPPLSLLQCSESRLCWLDRANFHPRTLNGADLSVLKVKAP